MPDTIDINTLFGPMPSAASDLSVDDLTGLMERHAVAACCTLSTVGVLLDHHAGNSATRAACSENSRLIPVATINPQAFFGGDGQHSRFAAEGFRLARFFPRTQGWPSDYAPFVTLVRTLEAERLPIMVEVDGPGSASRLVHALGSHTPSIILAGVDTRTVAEAVALMRTHPHVYVETSNLVAAGALKHVVEAVGADRALYGSGAPARPMAAGLSVLRYSGLNDTQCEEVLGGNARRLLGM